MVSMKLENYISTTEAAEVMGISREAVLKQIKTGKLQAEKIAGNFLIDKNNLGTIYQEITPDQEKKVEKAVARVLKDYKATLIKLGKE